MFLTKRILELAAETRRLNDSAEILRYAYGHLSHLNQIQLQ